MKNLFLTFLFLAIITPLLAQKNMKTPKPYTILVLMNASSKWLSLTRDERNKYFEKKVIPIFEKVSKSVNVRLFDSEYFHAKVSDFMIVSTSNLDDYKLFIELLRDTKIYGEPYFDIVDIIVGQEDAFLDFNELLKKENDEK
ncbi:darcynin family protein [Emticicia sp. SJ17W-69]|uniref:darcynin family protein n=1 Tax=Emticicia sp. SJ17W-69 TaxID=3421657 RepID=UPI003EBEA529